MPLKTRLIEFDSKIGRPRGVLGTANIDEYQSYSLWAQLTPIDFDQLSDIKVVYT